MNKTGGGKCVPRWSGDTLHKICVPRSRGCSSNRDCPTQQECHHYFCRPLAPACKLDSDCAALQIKCFGRQNRTERGHPPTIPPRRPGYTCKENHCHLSPRRCCNDSECDVSQHEHCAMGFTEDTDATKVEFDVRALLPENEWISLSHLIPWHGRRVCSARKPACETCGVAHVCPKLL